MHEQSETVQREDGKWINVYGKGTPQAGTQLPDSDAYDSKLEAVAAAKARSEGYGRVKPPQASEQYMSPKDRERRSRGPANF